MPTRSGQAALEATRNNETFISATDSILDTAGGIKDFVTSNFAKGKAAGRLGSDNEVAISKKNGTKSLSSGLLRFPDYLGTEEAPYWTTIYIFKYARKRQATFEEKGTMLWLPIPVDLSTSYGIGYEEFSRMHYGMQAANQLQSGDVGGALGTGIEKLSYEASSAGGVVHALGPQDLRSTREADRGLLRNPNTETRMSGVNMRTHSFTWTMWARNKAEWIAIQQIRKLLKIAMHPIHTGEDDAVGDIEYPFEFALKFGNDKGTFFTIGDSFLTEMRDVYNPAGQFFTEDGPISYSITCTFKESDALFRDDIANGDY